MSRTAPATDRSRDMEESAWWDLWNTSYRAEDNRDETSTELFTHVVGVVQQITNGRGCRILEVACGTGTLSRLLSFTSYRGLDMSSAAIEIARQKAELIQLQPERRRPTYEAADFHDWPLPAQQFDLVLCIDAITCFRDQQFTLRKISQGLATGGHVVLTSVNPFVYNRIRRADGGRPQNGPVSHWLSRRELHELILQAGLTIIHSYTIMPRGNVGFLRVINSRRLNQAFGPHVAAFLRLLKEGAGLGQYRVVVARKEGRV